MKQNNCVDIYRFIHVKYGEYTIVTGVRDYFDYEDDATREMAPDLKIIADYPDPCGRRPVSGVSWYSGILKDLMTSY